MLVSVDAPIGVPGSFLAEARRAFTLSAAASFPDLLAVAASTPSFFEPQTNPSEWSARRPFFRVAGGKGSLTVWIEAAAEQGVTLWRRIEKTTGGKSVFAHGLPGHVAPAARALWEEIAAIGTLASFSLWPFECALDDDGCPVILAENYPRAAYGTALAETLPAPARLIGNKSSARVRRAIIDDLKRAAWIKLFGVTLNDLRLAEAADADFDALLTVAALLRLVLEGRPLAATPADPVSEGGMLCA